LALWQKNGECRARFTVKGIAQRRLLTIPFLPLPREGWTGGLKGWVTRYYLNGWRLLQTTTIPSVKLDHITPDVVEALPFEGSPANGNNALRTLRRMLKERKSGRSSAKFHASDFSRKKAARCGSMTKPNASCWQLPSSR
jgi:hypothetical protein